MLARKLGKWSTEIVFKKKHECGYGSSDALPLFLQENGLSHAPGPTALRSSPALMSWPATTAPTRGRRSSVAPFAKSASCAATTWWSTPGDTQISSQECWKDPTAAAPHVPAPSATTAAQMPPAPPSAQPTRLKLKPGRTFLPRDCEARVFIITLLLHSCQLPPFPTLPFAISALAVVYHNVHNCLL